MLLQTLGYRLDESTGLIDYDEAELLAQLYRPKLIIGGASAYTRHVDYARLKDIAKKANAYLLSDMAHISGLVAAGADVAQCPPLFCPSQLSCSKAPVLSGRHDHRCHLACGCGQF